MRVNGIYLETDARTVAELLDELDIELRGIAVAVDSEIVRRADWTTKELLASSNVEILTAAAGG
jgi:sulfur carrier protein